MEKEEEEIFQGLSFMARLEDLLRKAETKIQVQFFSHAKGQFPGLECALFVSFGGSSQKPRGGGAGSRNNAHPNEVKL